MFRSDNLVACTRILLNIGLVFHRCNQMCTSMDPSSYPTLLHIRNVANQRFFSKDSLKVFSNILLDWANQEKEQEELSPVEIVNTCPSPAVAPARRSARHSSTPQVKMPCVQGMSSRSPGRGINMANLAPEFVEWCVNCDGTYPSMKHDPSKRSSA